MNLNNICDVSQNAFSVIEANKKLNITFNDPYYFEIFATISAHQKSVQCNLKLFIKCNLKCW